MIEALDETRKSFVVLGRVLRPHGVGGAFILTSYAENPAAFFEGAGLELRSPDGLKRRQAEGLTVRPSSAGLIIKISGLKCREEAAALKGWSLGLPREHLPPPPDDEIYWADLLGLAVTTVAGQALGRVENLMDAGAGLLLVVADPEGTERLIPFQPSFVTELDLTNGRLVVDTPPGLIDI